VRRFTSFAQDRKDMPKELKWRNYPEQRNQLMLKK
jgi:hypothetical protein